MTTPTTTGHAGAAASGEELTLASILESIQDVFYRVDAEGRVEVVSRSGALELGYGDPSELLGRPVEAVWAYPERRTAMLEALHRDGVVRDWEVELKRRDGSILIASTTVHRLSDAAGRPAGYQGIWRNITERKRAEEELRSSEEKFAQIFRTVPDTIVVSRAGDGLLLDVNPGFEAVTGWTRDEALGRSTVALDLWADPAARDRMVAELRERGEVLDRELVFKRKDGERRTGIFSARTLRIRGDLCVVFLMRDVTERREAQALARLQERRLAQAVEGGNLGTWEWDPRTGVQHVNARWAEMLGLGHPTELDDPLRAWRDRIHPEDAGRVDAALQAYLEGRAPIYEAEYRVRHRDGRWIWVLAAGRVMERDAEGRVSRVCGTHLDVSERHRLEEERERLEAQLRQAQKLEAVGQVAGGVAHDFNNLLTVQLGALEVLKELPGLSEEALTLAEEIEHGARSAAALTRQLLAFSRRQILQVTRADLAALVASFLGMLRRVVPESIQLELRPPEGPLWIDADVGMTQQVVMNLALNARDAMPGGGLLTLACDAVEVAGQPGEAGEARPGRYVRLTVSDTGHGMDEATQRRLFEPFFTTKPAGRGTGLGLATVYGIVKQHGGWIQVESRVGRGSTFRVNWPEARAGAPAGRAAGRVAAATPGRGERVLLVEDDAGVRRTVTGWLERLGYVVLACPDGPSGLARFAAEGGRIDLLLTDMLLPGGLSGRAVVERLRAVDPGLPAVVMSGYSADLVEGGVPPGAGLVEKPCDPQTLARALRQALDGHAQG